MAKCLDLIESSALFERLAAVYDLYGPVLDEGKGKLSDSDCVKYGTLSSFRDIVTDKKSYFSAKEAVFPVREVMFNFKSDEISVPELNEKEKLVFLRSCDIHAMDRLDKIFLENGNEKDFYYKRRRDKIHFVLLECLEKGFKSCYCVSMGTNHTDNFVMAINFGSNGIELTINEKSFEVFLKDLGNSSDHKVSFVSENNTEAIIPDVNKVDKSHFTDEMWLEYTARCIACGRCNTSCPTCSCFTVQDVTLGSEDQFGERRRRWAGCHIKGFTEMAGGHKFRDKNGERMRYKTMHKVNDFYKRFGVHMCVGCGRCDDVCPEYISFSRCINTLNSIVEKGGK